MRFSIAYLFLAAAAVFGADDKPTQTINLASMQGQISQLVNFLPSVPATFKPATDVRQALSGVGAPPSSLVAAIMTAVPSDVFADVINPASRKAIASSFKAGKTPGWFNDLPTPVKKYFSELAAKMTSAGVSYREDSPLATGLGSSGGTGKTDGDPKLGSGGSSSSSALAPRHTGAVAGSLAVVVGVLGAAIAL
ncbi:hypothetical protein FQN50_003501 [Emmonsiellopsis sp. PD_5]|nr:hypothetical protein FQN50_003501 [Emmonsiellopsis sp. PD_5]